MYIIISTKMIYSYKVRYQSFFINFMKSNSEIVKPCNLEITVFHSNVKRQNIHVHYSPYFCIFSGFRRFKTCYFSVSVSELTFPIQKFFFSVIGIVSSKFKNYKVSQIAIRKNTKYDFRPL